MHTQNNTASATIVSQAYLLGQLPGGGQDECLRLVGLHVNPLQDGDGEGGRLACARLCLSNGVVAPDAGHDGPLLDGRRLLKAISVDTSQESFIQVHVIEARGHLPEIKE